MSRCSPFLENDFFLNQPWDDEKQESDDHFAEEQMETKACIEESNQEGIENKESNRKSQVTTSGSSQAVFVLKD